MPANQLEKNEFTPTCTNCKQTACGVRGIDPDNNAPELKPGILSKMALAVYGLPLLLVLLGAILGHYWFEQEVAAMLGASLGLLAALFALRRLNNIYWPDLRSLWNNLEKGHNQ